MGEPDPGARPRGRRAQRSGPPAGHLPRLVWRKLVHRRATFLRAEARAADHVAPSHPIPAGLRLEVLGPGTFDDVLGSSPHLTATDLERFRARPSWCIVVRDGERIAASSWMTSGAVEVDELARTLPIGAGEHYSCRTWVDPEHRGSALFGHMIAGYAASVPPGDVLWGILLERNVASLASLQRIGWRATGWYRTRWVLGVPRRTEGRHEPRPLLPGRP
ncbi:MAG TPA: hypothetical protein VHK88_12985 [Aquihabitans sp.]|nr:hypothetical protein [Aquihabitans sp.]